MEQLAILSVAVILFVLSYLIGKKDKIHLIHSYHYKRVDERNRKAYTENMGIALLVMGLGCMVSFFGGLVMAEMPAAPCIIGMVIGILLFVRNQYRYNGGIF